MPQIVNWRKSNSPAYAMEYQYNRMMMFISSDHAYVNTSAYLAPFCLVLKTKRNTPVPIIVSLHVL
jgi:hypothetical protein